MWVVSGLTASSVVAANKTFEAELEDLLTNHKYKQVIGKVNENSKTIQTPEPYVIQSEAFCIVGKYQDALDAAEKALKLDDEDEDAHCRKADALLELDKVQESLVEVNRAIQLNSESGEAFTSRANVQIELENYTGALEDCAKALKLDPNLPDAYAARASAAFELEQYERATTDCDRALKLDPLCLDALRVKVKLLEESGNLELAKEFKRKIKSISDG